MFDGTMRAQRVGVVALHPTAHVSDESTPLPSQLVADPFEHASVFGVQLMQPLTGSHPFTQGVCVYVDPVGSQTSAVFPSTQVLNCPAVQATAMHAPGFPATLPSMSQNGNAGSVQVPLAEHFAAGFSFVHANAPRTVQNAKLIQPSRNIRSLERAIGTRSSAELGRRWCSKLLHFE